MTKLDAEQALAFDARWDDESRTAFEAFLRRARSQREMHLRRKALALEGTRDSQCLRAALELRRRVYEAATRRDKNAKLEMLVEVASLHRRLDEDPLAERLLREALPLLPPASRSLEAQRWPERALARLLEFAGRTEESDALWSDYTAGLLSVRFGAPPRTLAEVVRDRGVVGIDGSPYRGLDDAAEHFLVNHHVRRGLTALFDANRAALVALDADARLEPLLGPQPGEARRAVPELGAYLARCAVRSAGATYVDAPHLLASRITLRGEARDPFAAAFRVLERGASCARAFDALLA